MEKRLFFWPTAFGPNLLCILAIVFLSATVTYATTNNAGNINNRFSIIEITVMGKKFIFICAAAASQAKARAIKC